MPDSKPQCHPADTDGDGTAIRLWWIPLDEPTGDPGVLGIEERDRADRFVRDIHRRRFIACHVALRRILGGITGEDPARIPIGKDEWGKPCLTESNDIHFNLAHSGDRALLAVAARPVGVDIELGGRIMDRLAVAERFFTPREADLVACAGEGDAAERAFLRVWTAKEAILKLLGLGLRVDLASFDAGDAVGSDAFRVVPPGLPSPVHLRRPDVPEGHSFLATHSPVGQLPVQTWSG